MEAKVSEMVFTQAAGAALAGASAHTIAQGALKSVTLTTLKITAAVTCGLILAGGVVYRGIAGVGRPAADGAVFKGVAPAVQTPSAAPVAPSGFQPVVFTGNPDAAQPAQVKVSVAYIDAALSDVDRLSKQIASGDDHDALLQDALIKNRANVVSCPQITTGDRTMGRINLSTRIPIGTGSGGPAGPQAPVSNPRITPQMGQVTTTTQIVNDAKADGKPSFIEAPNSTEVTPRINPNGTITVLMTFTKSEVVPGGNPPPVTSSTIRTLRTFRDGQTLSFANPSVKPGDSVEHLVFVTVAMVPSALVSTSAIVVTNLYGIDVAPSAYEAASGQVPPGDNHDGLLLAELKKSGANVVLNSSSLTKPGYTDGAALGKDVIFFIPRIKPDGSITEKIDFDKSEFMPGVTQTAETKHIRSTTLTFHEGQTLLIDRVSPSKPDDQAVHLTFMTVITVPGNPAAASAGSPARRAN